MANESLTISTDAINPVLPLAYLIKAALEDVCEQPDEFHTHYREQFSLLVGLSLTAMLIKGDQKQEYEKYLCVFFNLTSDFTRCLHEFDQISLFIAEVVCHAMRSFECLGYPSYFNDFIQAIISVIYPIERESNGKKRKIYLLLQKLFQIGK